MRDRPRAASASASALLPASPFISSCLKIIFLNVIAQQPEPRQPGQTTQDAAGSAYRRPLSLDANAEASVRMGTLQMMPQLTEAEQRQEPLG